jgi:signal transduction histidine kinase
VGGYEYAGVKQLRKLLDAVMALGSELSLSVVLRRITEVATELVDAQYGAVGVLDPSGTRLSEFITVGIDGADYAAIGKLPEGHGILGLLIKDAKPLRLPDLAGHPDSYGFPPNHPPMSSFLGVPILLRNEIFGNLYLTEKADGDVFTDVDEELVVALAAAAGVAIENARLHEQARHLTLADERDRMARDLHDDVIQRLFATGLTVQSIAQVVKDDGVADRMIQVVDDLDETIRRLRSTIFELRRTRQANPSVRADVIAVCNEAARALGFEPMCVIRGPLDMSVSPGVASHLVLTLREALSNVARHALATLVEVRVTVADGRVTLIVEDDGVGVAADGAAGGQGLANMARRASEIGGSSSLGPAGERGTLLLWEAPVDANDRQDV